MTLNISPGAVEINGPLGSKVLPYPPFMSIVYSQESQSARLSTQDAMVREQRAMWGTMRALLQNHVHGVADGHAVVLRLVGIGYRATAEREGRMLALKLGFANTIELEVPPAIKASCPSPTRILLESIDKNLVTQFAATIREYRKPSPYKGKGIFIGYEQIKLKTKK